jgi:hypothetical protein
MAQDRFVKTCLVAIALLLSIIALNSIVRPQTSHAAVKYNYRVVEAMLGAPIQLVQARIDEAATQGWELVCAPTWQTDAPSSSPRGLLIFRRPSE